MKGFLQTGQVNVTIVPELVKLHNNVLLMRMLANVLGLTEANKQRYNLYDNYAEGRTEECLPSPTTPTVTGKGRCGIVISGLYGRL